MKVIRASMDMLEQILPVYTAARQFMEKTGNPNQWGKTHPSRELLQRHIRMGNLYVVEYKEKVVGAFAFIPGTDPTYLDIEGQWHSCEKYAAIHCVASDGSVRGVFSEIWEYCKSQERYLRIDTHHDNKVMQHVLEKNGFVPCGVIYLENGDPRLAYDRME